MTFDEACGIKNPHAIAHGEKYRRYLERIGQEEVARHIPFSTPELVKAWLKDRNMNNLPLSKWERAAGYSGGPDRQGAQPEKASGPFPRLLMSHGVTLFSSSECVCLLKYAAEQIVIAELAKAYEHIKGDDPA